MIGRPDDPAAAFVHVVHFMGSPPAALEARRTQRTASTACVIWIAAERAAIQMTLIRQRRIEDFQAIGVSAIS